jgi:hypothetical protein
MIAGVYNITCQQGSTFSRLLEIEQPDLVTDPTGQTYIPYDLSGYAARMQVRRTIESPTPMVTLDTGNGGLEINPTEEEDKTHHIRIYMTDEVTASISSSGVYDIEIVNADGEVSRIMQGAFSLSLEVTR